MAKKRKKDVCPEIVDNTFARCNGSVTFDNLPRPAGVGNPAIIGLIAQFVFPLLTNLLNKCGKDNNNTVSQQAVSAGFALQASAQQTRSAYLAAGKDYCQKQGIPYRRREWLLSREHSQILTTAGLHEIANRPADQIEDIATVGGVIAVTVSLQD